MPGVFYLIRVLGLINYGVLIMSFLRKLLDPNSALTTVTIDVSPTISSDITEECKDIKNMLVLRRKYT